MSTPSIVEAYGFRSHEAMAKWIREEYGLDPDSQHHNAHRIRREVIAQRLRLYRDDGRAEFERVIDSIFETQTVRDQRKAMIRVATEQNVTQRIVHEVASLYDQPAMRELASESEREKFKELATALELDEVMQEGQRLTFLCNEALLWRERDEEDDELRILTPDCFDAISHPKRKLREIGFLIDAYPSFVPEGATREDLTHYELWDSRFHYQLNAHGHIVDATPHGLGGIPGVLLHRRKPVDRILDDRAGRDITAAHLGVGLLEIMAMRLSKSQGERQPVLRGNLAAMAMGQSADGEKPLLLPPEVVAEMLETKTDPDHYIRKKKDKISGVAQNYGMSYEQFVFHETADTASGKAYQVRRIKLTELRNEQVRRARVHERKVMLLLDLNPTGMKLDFQEQTIPQDATEEIALLKEKLPLGLDSPVQFRMRKNPEETREQAVAAIKRNLTEWAIVVLEARALNMPADGDANNPGRSPQDNGADNEKKDDAATTERDEEESAAA